MEYYPAIMKDEGNFLYTNTLIDCQDTLLSEKG